MTAGGHDLLTVENLSVHFPGDAGRTVRAVERVSLRVARGETLALVGESGSGKSMLCRSIMGIQPRRAVLPGPKRILFGGRDLTRLPPQEVQRICGREIGIVLQNPISSLNPVMTIESQLVEPMIFHLGVSKAQARGRAFELLQEVGIPQPAERLKSYPHQLSGGMRQRVAIAIALSCDPRLLIADEPTTALDVTVQAEVLNLLGRFQREREMAMILVTHDLGVVAGRAHSTAVMYAGSILEQAATGELFDRMRHRYTAALFRAIPRLDHGPGHTVEAIPGQPPDLTEPRTGCPFAPRCPAAHDRCYREEPPTTEDRETGHRYACWSPVQKEARP
jgi:peptide/nickel transport system ATP-binding protein